MNATLEEAIKNLTIAEQNILNSFNISDATKVINN